MAMVIGEDYWAYNFSVPTYKKFVSDVYNSIKTSYSETTAYQMTPSHWIDTINEYGCVTRQDVLYFFGLAVFWTVLRYLVTALILKPLLSFSKLGKHERKKAPESAWKFLFYSSTWCYSVYLLFFSNYDFFFNSPLTFYKWRNGQPVPLDIYVFYMVQLSFYMHSIYGTIFMDVWRKDSKVMLLHHVVTLLLVGFSFSFRFTNVGVLILFLHDVTDIILEFTKLVLYHNKGATGMWQKACDIVSTVGFVLFGAAWFVFRLYWYPLKAMYAAGHTSIVVMKREPPFYLFFNLLLWTLLLMNIYWFKYIVVMAYHVVTGKVQEVEDVREYEDMSSSSSESEGSPKRPKEMNGKTRYNGVSKKQR